MLFLRGKSTAVTEKEGTQLKDERGVVDVEDHEEPPSGASPLSLVRLPRSGTHLPWTPSSQLHTRPVSSDDVRFLEDAASCHGDTPSTRDLTPNTIPVHLAVSLTSVHRVCGRAEGRRWDRASSSSWSFSLISPSQSTEPCAHLQFGNRDSNISSPWSQITELASSRNRLFSDLRLQSH